VSREKQKGGRVTFKEIAQELCRREGKKSGVNIAQMSEILRCLGEILVECHGGFIGGSIFSYKPKKKK
jgi:hypothetical protein